MVMAVLRGAPCRIRTNDLLITRRAVVLYQYLLFIFNILYIRYLFFLCNEYLLLLMVICTFTLNHI